MIPEVGAQGRRPHARRSTPWRRARTRPPGATGTASIASSATVATSQARSSPPIQPPCRSRVAEEEALHVQRRICRAGASHSACRCSSRPLHRLSARAPPACQRVESEGRRAASSAQHHNAYPHQSVNCPPPSPEESRHSSRVPFSPHEDPSIPRGEVNNSEGRDPSHVVLRRCLRAGTRRGDQSTTSDAGRPSPRGQAAVSVRPARRRPGSARSSLSPARSTASPSQATPFQAERRIIQRPLTARESWSERVESTNATSVGLDAILSVLT